MTTQELKKEIVKNYDEKGLNSVYAFLKRNSIKYKLDVNEFGLQTNKVACKDKYNWVDKSELKFHYYSKMVKSRKTGYYYNQLRGVEIILL